MSVSNNRLSVVVDAKTLADVKQAFEVINQSLPFLIGLTPKERQTIPKISVDNKQFVADAVMGVNNNKELFPDYIQPVELEKDFNLYVQLDEVVVICAKLMSKLRDTQTLAGSEAYVTSLSAYKLVGAARAAGMPGAKSLHTLLAARFAGQGKVKGTVKEGGKK